MDIFYERRAEDETQQQAEAKAQSLKDIEKAEAPHRHFRLLEEWPVDLGCRAIKVGEYLGDYVILVGQSREAFEGPGKYICRTLPAMGFYKPELYKVTADVVWRANGERQVGKYYEKPADIAPEKEGLRPNHISGTDTWS